MTDKFSHVEEILFKEILPAQNIRCCLADTFRFEIYFNFFRTGTYEMSKISHSLSALYAKDCV